MKKLSDPKNSDLHMHSTASDGGYSPSELMNKCKQNHLQIVSLTDHDTVGGIAEAIEAAKKLEIQFIPGIELSTIHEGKSVHILGYGIDWKNKELCDMLKEQKELRNERVLKMIQKLKNVGIHISKEHIFNESNGGSLGRPHVAHALIKSGYVKTVAEAFSRYLAEGQVAYVKKSKEMTVKEAINWIHFTGGIAVVAHPIYYHKDQAIIEWINKWNLDGVEVYHRDHDDQTKRHYELFCDELDHMRDKPLFRTGGSDFHHEEYGRVLEPLGVTRIKNSLAARVLDRTR